MADSKVTVEGSNGFCACLLNGGNGIDPDFGSCEGEREGESVLLWACPFRVAAEGGFVGVSGETKIVPCSLSLDVNMVDVVDEVVKRATFSSANASFNGDCDRNAESPVESPEEAKLFSATEFIPLTWAVAGS